MKSSTGFCTRISRARTIRAGWSGDRCHRKFLQRSGGRIARIKFRKLDEEQHAVIHDLDLAAGIGGIDAESCLSLEQLARRNVSNRAALDEQKLRCAMPI